MSHFYFLHFHDTPGAPVAYGTDDPVRERVLTEPGRVASWAPVDLAVRADKPTDYLANNLGLRLCSARLRRVLEERRGVDEVQWLDVRVTGPNGQTWDYSVLHFPTFPDVLDPTATIWAGGRFIVKPVLARQAKAHSLFSFPGGQIRVEVAAAVRRAIESAECTGVDFSPVAMTA